MSDLPQIDPELGEALQPREREIAQKIAAIVARGVCTQFAAGGAPARRDVHRRAHGCVRATLHVAQSLPAELAKGVFVPGKTYAAWVRFSNGSTAIGRSDARGDVRAMAIKLVGVPGEKILANEHDAATQDFILLNAPVFPAHDAAGYLAFIARQASPNPLVQLAAPLALGLKGAFIGMKLRSSRISNPLTTRYWSTVAFRIGDADGQIAVKFSAVPRSAPQPLPRRPNPRFLREAMREFLGHSEATFDFAVQRRTPALSVEDPRNEWTETAAPFERVATLVIPPQDFTGAANDALAENLAFNPWHALPAHRPLGSINRTRRVVYETVADLRRRFNEAPLREPRG